MKMVRYDDGRVGRIDGEEIVRLDVPTMRTPIVPKKSFHTSGNFREREDESKRDTFCPLGPAIVTPDATGDPHEPQHGAPRQRRVAKIEKIGVLRNPVVSWQDAHGEPVPPRVRW